MNIISSVLINSSLPFLLAIFSHIHQHYSLPILSILFKNSHEVLLFLLECLWVSHYQMDHGQALKSCSLEEDYLEYFHSIKPKTHKPSLCQEYEGIYQMSDINVQRIISNFPN